MKLFNVTPYLLLLGQENSNEETLSKANAEFVKEVYELQRAESDITIVLFQLQYLSCRLVILREHYRTAPEGTSDLLLLYHRHSDLSGRDASPLQVRL